jgi:hypothetical protein
MTDDRLALLEALQKADDGNFLRALAETVLQILMEADVEGVIGAGRYERSGERTTWRNGYRKRTLDTRLGPLNLKIPKLRTGSPNPFHDEFYLSCERTSANFLTFSKRDGYMECVGMRYRVLFSRLVFASCFRV